MPILTVRLSDEVLREVDMKSKALNISKNAYIQRAISNLNFKINEDIKRERLIQASYKVRANSMEINAEFDSIEYGKKV
ncbi:CopG family transcriptional regulator [Candidatus Cyrtobacter comes]|uniref:CopG family transcriptional regulator n=1 Tax=Candidatus Cyrtobacter comes TaxID=675776 RepID=A0ABU5L987_9RICK|nr:CopG family transcriptional regulator [Candidatus Cyrtobacter comes]MDZ5762691.1 CopG family transcriptional regulator [Candidatus Cyrtobacter comes]